MASNHSEEAEEGLEVNALELDFSTSETEAAAAAGAKNEFATEEDQLEPLEKSEKYVVPDAKSNSFVKEPAQKCGAEDVAEGEKVPLVRVAHSVPETHLQPQSAPVPPSVRYSMPHVSGLEITGAMSLKSEDKQMPKQQPDVLTQEDVMLSIDEKMKSDVAADAGSEKSEEGEKEKDAEERAEEPNDSRSREEQEAAEDKGETENEKNTEVHSSDENTELNPVSGSELQEARVDGGTEGKTEDCYHAPDFAEIQNLEDPKDETAMEGKAEEVPIENESEADRREDVNDTDTLNLESKKTAELLDACFVCDGCLDLEALKDERNEEEIRSPPAAAAAASGERDTDVAADFESLLETAGMVETKTANQDGGPACDATPKPGKLQEDGRVEEKVEDTVDDADHQKEEEDGRTEENTEAPDNATFDDADEENIEAVVNATSDDTVKENIEAPDNATSDDIDKENIEAPDNATSDDIDKENIEAPDNATSDDIDKENIETPDNATSDDKENIKAPDNAASDDIDKVNIKTIDNATSDSANDERVEAPVSATSDDASEENVEAFDRAKNDDAKEENIDAPGGTAADDVNEENIELPGNATADDADEKSKAPATAAVDDAEEKKAETPDETVNGANTRKLEEEEEIERSITVSNATAAADIQKAINGDDEASLQSAEDVERVKEKPKEPSGDVDDGKCAHDGAAVILESGAGKSRGADDVENHRYKVDFETLQEADKVFWDGEMSESVDVHEKSSGKVCPQKEERKEGEHVGEKTEENSVEVIVDVGTLPAEEEEEHLKSGEKTEGSAVEKANDSGGRTVGALPAAGGKEEGEMEGRTTAPKETPADFLLDGDVKQQQDTDYRLQPHGAQNSFAARFSMPQLRRLEAAGETSDAAEETPLRMGPGEEAPTLFGASRSNPLPFVRNLFVSEMKSQAGKGSASSAAGAVADAAKDAALSGADNEDGKAKPVQGCENDSLSHLQSQNSALPNSRCSSGLETAGDAFLKGQTGPRDPSRALGQDGNPSIDVLVNTSSDGDAEGEEAAEGEESRTQEEVPEGPAEAILETLGKQQQEDADEEFDVEFPIVTPPPSGQMFPSKSDVAVEQEARIQSEHAISDTKVDGKNELARQESKEKEMATSTSTVCQVEESTVVQERQQAEEEWESVQTIQPGFATADATTRAAPSVEIKPALKYHQALEALSVADYSTIKRNVRTQIARHGFQALKNFFFGPPKLHPDLWPEREMVFCYAGTSFQEGNSTHLDMLQSVYRQITGSRFDGPRYGSHWENIGFQGSDPSSDLRATGMLAPLQMLSFLGNPKVANLARDTFRLSQDAYQNFPFCVIGINLTRTCLQALREDLLNRECNKQNAVMNVVNEFYAGLFLKFYSIWKNGKTIVDSGHVMDTLTTFAKKSTKNVFSELRQFTAKAPSSSNDPREAVDFTDVCGRE